MSPEALRALEQLQESLQRFFQHVEDLPNGCWNWKGPFKSKGGYGAFYRRGSAVLAHRWSYERFVGPVKDGFELDHTCRRRTCVNPKHLEQVTKQENLRRMWEHRRYMESLPACRRCGAVCHSCLPKFREEEAEALIERAESA